MEERFESEAAGTSARTSAARARANAWLARFAPLLEAFDVPNAAVIREALATLSALRKEGDAVLADLDAIAEPEDAALVNTLKLALPQIETLETDLRRRLAHLAPGDPEGMVDLDALRDDLARLAARQELGQSASAQEITGKLTLPLSTGSVASAAGMGCFGTAWTSFTIFHSVVMIGGMVKGFGWLALIPLLAFYSLFYAVGIGMLLGAVTALGSESVEIDGREAVVRWKLGPWMRQKRRKLSPRSRAGIAQAAVRQKGTPGTELSLVDADGKELRFGKNVPEHLKSSHVATINKYLAALPDTGTLG